MKPKYPDIEVKLVGENGNAFVIMGKVAAEMRQAGVPEEEIETFTKEATSGDYDNLLQTCLWWVTCY